MVWQKTPSSALNIFINKKIVIRTLKLKMILEFLDLNKQVQVPQEITKFYFDLEIILFLVLYFA
jgi:hypothetical protein